MQNQWREQLLEKAVEETVRTVVSKLGTAAGASLQPVYRGLFRVQLNALGTNQAMATDIFQDLVDEKIGSLKALNQTELQKAVREDTFRSEVLPLDETIEKTGLALLRGEEVDDRARRELRETCVRINELSIKLPREFPELGEELGPKISESLLDCQFIQNGGKPTSLRLSRAAQSAK